MECDEMAGHIHLMARSTLDHLKRSIARAVPDHDNREDECPWGSRWIRSILLGC